MIKEILLGFLVGLGKIIPGVSGAMIAISFGIYDKLINCIINPFKNKKFICTIGIGFLIAVVFGSKAIVYFMDNYYFLTMIFFIGLISGGMPKIIEKSYGKGINKKSIIITIITFFIVILLSMFKTTNKINNTNYLFTILIGIIESCTMIIPGISGTAVLMMLGYYDTVMKFLNNIFNLSHISSTIQFAIPFLIGIMIGAYFISKLIKYLLSKYPDLFFAGITGFAISTILIMFKEAFISSVSVITFLESIVFITIGFIISYKFDK